MQIATFVLAVTGVVLSAASLTWQAASFALSGGRVKVQLRAGGVHTTGRGMMTAPATGFSERTMVELSREGYARFVVAVQVTNVGRMPVTVSDWSLLAAPGGMAYTPLGDVLGPALPFRLDAGESETWAVDLNRAHGLAAASTVTTQPADGVFAVRGRVRLGDGRSYMTREVLRVSGDAEST